MKTTRSRRFRAALGGLLLATASLLPFAAPGASAAPAPAKTTSNPLVPSDDYFLLRSAKFQQLDGACNMRDWTAEDRSRLVFGHVDTRFLTNQKYCMAGEAPAGFLYLGGTLRETGLHRNGVIAVSDSGNVLWIDRMFGSRAYMLYPEENVIREFAQGNGANVNAAVFRPNGELIVADDNVIYRYDTAGGPPVVIAGSPIGVLQDTTALQAAILVGSQILSDSDGNIWFTEQPRGRVRMLRANDNRIVTIAGASGSVNSEALAGPSGIALDEPNHLLYIIDGTGFRSYTLDLQTGVRTFYSGTGSDDIPLLGRAVLVGGSLYAIPDLSNPGLYRVNPNNVPTPVTPVAGLGDRFADASQSTSGSQLALGTLFDIARDASGRIYLSGFLSMVLSFDPATDQVGYAGGVVRPIEMGSRAFWFGADMNSAPDEVRNWTHSYGYGNNWTQWLESPTIPVSPTSQLSISFDANLGLADLSNEHLAVYVQAASGAWLSASYTIMDASPLPPVQQLDLTGGPRYFATTGMTKVDLYLWYGQDPALVLGPTTRIRLSMRSNTAFSSEDDPTPSTGLTGVVVDNLRVLDGATAVIPAVDFEDGTTGGWTPGARNFAWDGGINLAYTDHTSPPSVPDVRSGFDPAVPANCVWSFTDAAGDTVPEGVLARLTSPWIRRYQPQNLFIKLSGKLATTNQARFVTMVVRAKNAGDVHARVHAAGNFLLTSGTAGTDAASAYFTRTFLEADDLQMGVGYDSVQIVLEIQDRARTGLGTRTTSRLPYIDDVEVAELAADSDYDGVADDVDVCFNVCAAGQDADRDGCPDPTATMRHVESWPTARTPIRWALSTTGLPGVSDGSDAAAVRAASYAWREVPGARNVLEELLPVAATASSGTDGLNLVTFRDPNLDFPPSVLAVTPTLSYDRPTNYDDSVVPPFEIVDADIIVNGSASLKTASKPGNFDLQGVVTHEFGHLLGLVHSGVKDATMYFVQLPAQDARSLESDDLAAYAAAYPAAELQTSFARIEGRVLRDVTGNGLPGALVTAVRLDGAGAPMDTVASDYSDEEGVFRIFRLPPGTYGVHVQPLDGSVLDGLTPGFVSDRLAFSAVTGFDPEWWNDTESAFDDRGLKTPLVLAAGEVGIATISTNLDTLPPSVASVSPANGATDVGIDATLLVNFSDAVQAPTLSSAFKIRKLGNTGSLGGNGLLSSFGKTFVFTPEFPLAFGTTYELVVTTALSDLNGLHPNADFVATFTTQAQPAVAITDVQPRSAIVGATLTVTGSGFDATVPGNNLLVVNDGPDSLNVGFVTPNSLVATLTSPLPPGPFTVKVVRGGGPDVSNTFNLTAIAPSPQSTPAPNGSPVGLAFVPRDVTLSPDGTMAYVAGDEGFATVNYDAGRAASQPAQHPLRTAVTRFASKSARVVMSRDGRRAFVSQPDALRILEVDADPGSVTFGAPLDTIPLTSPPVGLAISRNGRRLYATDQALPQIVEIDVDPASPSRNLPLRNLATPLVPQGGIAVSADARTLLYTGFDGAREIDLVTGAANGAAVGPTNGSIATDLNGRRAWFGSPFGGARMVDNRRISPGPTSLGGQAGGLAHSPIGPSVFAVVPSLNRLAVVDADSGSALFNSRIAEVETGSSPAALAVNANGGVIVVGNAGDRTLSLYSYGASGAPAVRAVSAIAAFPGDRIAVRGDSLTSNFGAGTTVDLGFGTPFAAQNPQGLAAGFTLPDVAQRDASVTLERSDGQRTLALPLRIVDPLPSASPRATDIRFPPTLLSAAICPTLSTSTGHVLLMRVTPDGRRLLVHQSDPAGLHVSLMAITTKDNVPFGSTLLSGLVQLPDIMDDMEISADGRFAYLAWGDLGVPIFDMDPASPAAGTVVSYVGGVEAGTPRTIAADPLGRWFVAGHEIGTADGISFWEAGKASPGLKYTLPGVSAHTLAVSGDGRMLLAGWDGRAYVVDANARTLLATTTQHGAADSAIRQIAISRNGRYGLGIVHPAVQPAAGGSRITIWNLDPAAGAVGAELYHGPVPGAPGITLDQLTTGPDGSSFLALRPGTDSLLKIHPAPLAVETWRTGFRAQSFTLGPDGRQLWVAGTLDDASCTNTTRIRLFDLSEGASLSLVSGAGQSAFPLEALPIPVRARVLDANGNPEAGVTVRFQLPPASGLTFPGGTFAGAGPNTSVLVPTDANGEAEVQWVLPAPSASLNLTMSVTAVGVPGAATTVTSTLAENSAEILPEIVEFGPADGATGINAGTQAFVRFNQAMQASAATRAHLTANSQPVTARVTFSDGGRFMLLTPERPLPFGSTCVLTMDSGALDTDGQELASGASATFTVESPPALEFTTLSPPSGPEGASVVLTGNGFSPTPSLNTVRFNGVVAPVQSASITALVCEVPKGATSGPVTIETGGNTSGAVSFLVLAGSGVGGALGDLSAAEGIRDIAITPNGRRVYVTNPSLNTVSALQVAEAVNLGNVSVGLRPQGISITPEGDRAYVTNTGSNDVSVIDTDSLSATFNTELKKIKVGPAPVDIAISGNSKVVVVNSGDGTISVIDGNPVNVATYDRVTTTVNCGAGAQAVAVSADGTRAWVAIGAGLAIVDLVEQRVTTTVNCGAGAQAVSVSADNTLAFVLTTAGELKVIYLGEGPQKNQVVTSVNCGAGAQAVAVSADNTLAYVTLSDGKSVVVYKIDLANGASASAVVPGPSVVLTPVATIPVGDGPAGMAVDLSGVPRLFVANQGSGTVTVIGFPGGLPTLPVEFTFAPQSLNLKSMGRWVKGVIEPVAPARPEDIDLASVRLNLTVPVDLDAPHSIGDEDHDGRPDLTVKFLRSAVDLTVQEGDQVPVQVTGMIGPRQFAGRDTIKVKRGKLTSPAPHAVLAPGSATTVSWTTPNGTNAAHVQVSYSLDAGASWTVAAANAPNSGSFSWTVPMAITTNARVAVAMVEDAAPPAGEDPEVLGVLAMSGDFTIYGATAVEAAPASLQFSPLPNPAHGALDLRFGLPRRTDVALELFDVQGRLVRTLARGVREPGWHELSWKGVNEAGGRVDAGLYFVRLKADGRELKQRLVWLR